MYIFRTLGQVDTWDIVHLGVQQCRGRGDLPDAVVPGRRLTPFAQIELARRYSNVAVLPLVYEPW